MTDRQQIQEEEERREENCMSLILNVLLIVCLFLAGCVSFGQEYRHRSWLLCVIPLKMAPAPALSSANTKNPSFKSQKARSGLSSSAANLSLSAVAGSEEREFVQLNALGLKWTEDGKRLVVLGKDRFCSCDIAFKEDSNGSTSVDMTIVDEEGALN